MIKKTNFDQYLEEKLQDEDFNDRFRKADKNWDKILKVKSSPEKDIQEPGGIDDP
ncbi:MAG: hypothetical protein NT140_03030 [Deltaproteobacteria bacterium]|nr:hypothetical protein [Deltaproteobacteria bacterium]